MQETQMDLQRQLQAAKKVRTTQAMNANDNLRLLTIQTNLQYDYKYGMNR